jgi:hypothetical protein
MILYFTDDDGKINKWWINMCREFVADKPGELQSPIEEFRKFNAVSGIVHGRSSTVESVLKFETEEDATAFMLKWG